MSSMNNKYFEDFYLRMKDTNFDLKTFNNNLKSLVIKKNGFSSQARSGYNIKDNQILYGNGYLDVTIMHELFHVASTVVKSDEIRSGFYSVNLINFKPCREGFNEGYTAILDDRYFSDYVEDKAYYVGDTYGITKYLVSLIEDFIGTNEMEEMYSLNQIEKLENILNKYMGKKRTRKFFNALDLICKYVDKSEIPKIKVGYVCYEYCKKYIFDLYLRRIQANYIIDTVDDNLNEDDIFALMDDEVYENKVEEIKPIIQKRLCFGKILKLKSKRIRKEEIDERIDWNMKIVQEKQLVK